MSLGQVTYWTVTERQLDYLRQLMKLCHVAEATLLNEVNRVRRAEWLAVTSINELRREQAGFAIDLLIAVRDGKCPPPAPPGQTRFL